MKLDGLARARLNLLRLKAAAANQLEDEQLAAATVGPNVAAAPSSATETKAEKVAAATGTSEKPRGLLSLIDENSRSNGVYSIAAAAFNE